MNIKQIKEEINRISKIKDPVQCQEEIRMLNKKIGKVFIAQIRGNYAYFYKIKYSWNPEKKRSVKKISTALGKMPKNEYLKDKDKIKRLPINELKKIIIVE